MALVKMLLPRFEVELERDTIMKRFDFDSNVSNFIRGRVLFHPKIKTNLNELVLVLEGKLSVDPPDGYKNLEKTIIQQKLILCAQSDQGVSLSPACHEYAFELCIPGDLPESFRGDYGSLAYKIRAFGTISDYWSLSSIKTERNLHILRDMSPLYDTYSKSISGTWQNSVSYEATIPSNGFAPGDVIPVRFKYHVENDNVRVNLAISYLREISVYRTPSSESTAGGILREDHKTIDLDGYYDENSTEGDCELKLKVPANLTSFGCISEYSQLTHKVCFRVDCILNGEHESIVFTLPVYILPDHYTKLSPDSHAEDELPTYDIIPPPPSYEAILPRNHEQQPISCENIPASPMYSHVVVS
ncbi:hypothetical protein K493DRAFT_348637 [Basidiobolus meristosporus CBS 931.73]|uniref:Arrestin C-terminal-like domain-containing protein n=1 Tax=Basidiobolus meristosporus CBS 931.73 TaxID=1314790 RepID=A0A1Y1YNC5_9FUNG|nr:hypothetical protein K493DRAFT_348637 [Basidiobolus meristosporus CBS 931.73]|eukprot:ORX99333.1 hypothetical protein K493DRAFT_348637 [Basidiobolus meristosporus CBS 931.73]